MSEFFGEEVQVITIAAPVGAMMDWPGDVAPTDWMFAKGQALPKGAYPALHAVLQERFGSGDGSGDEFNIPNCQDRTVVGTSATKLLAAMDGAETVTHKHARGTMQSPAHHHNHNHQHYIDHVHGVGTSDLNTIGVAAGGSGPVSKHGHTHGNTGGSTRAWSDLPNNGDTDERGPFDITGETADASSSVMQPYISLNKIIKVV